MDTNEKVIMRLGRIKAFIQFGKKVDFRKMDTWALVNLGLTQRTMAKYLNALEDQDMVKIDREKEVITWI